MNKISLPEIAPSEATPLVQALLALIEQQHAHLAQLNERVEQLEAELARTKRLPPRPKIQPNVLDKAEPSAKTEPKSSPNKPTPRRRSGQKRTLTVHHTEVIRPETLPPGSRLLGYQDYHVQDIEIRPCNTRYRLARYRTPDGHTRVGRLPPALQGSHFGPTLRSFILYQYHHQRVTQPLLLQQLHEWGVIICAGQLSRLLVDDKTPFHIEKQGLLSAGIAAGGYLQVDDTGARHDGHNGYCTHLGNELFAFFQSTHSKSRINFLELLRGPHTDYRINTRAIDYLRAQGLPQALSDALRNATPCLPNEAAWHQHLQQCTITRARYRRIATEGALIGSLMHHGFPEELVILSDDAAQFDVLPHALCWIHAERVFQRLVPCNDAQANRREWVRAQIWEIYADLKAYKSAPNDTLKSDIRRYFDELCRTRTGYASLDRALKRLANNKSELLLVLERPEIPLHNNLSENDIREYVIKRKISGSTRSEEGRKSRDTFASLKKTCRKLGIRFWDYLIDRVSLTNNIHPLPELIRERSTPPT